MPRCSGTTRAGERCTAIVAAGSAYCYHHDPARASERSRHAAKAARGPRATGELREIKAELVGLISDLREQRVDPKIGAVIVQVMNTRLRALALEREVR